MGRVPFEKLSYHFYIDISLQEVRLIKMMKEALAVCEVKGFSVSMEKHNSTQEEIRYGNPAVVMRFKIKLTPETIAERKTSDTKYNLHEFLVEWFRQRKIPFDSLFAILPYLGTEGEE